MANNLAYQRLSQWEPADFIKEKVLLKLEQGVSRTPLELNEATSHMFIINPLSGQKLANLFSTHLAIKDRVTKLRRQGR